MFGKVNMMNMDWIDHDKFKAPESCFCSDVTGSECEECCAAFLLFAVRQTIQHCGRIALEEVPRWPNGAVQGPRDAMDYVAAKILAGLNEHQPKESP